MSQIKGFKGFDRNLKCRDTQYEIGKTKTFNGTPKLCEKGLHFCEDPLDVLAYYAPCESRFAEVLADGVTDETEDDSKRVSKSLTIEAEISLAKLLTTGISFRLSKHDFANAPDKAVGDNGAASATGDNGAASATGERGAASAMGYRGAASATGDNGAASATGDSGAASATGDNGAASATGYSGAASATGDRGAASAMGYRGAASATGEEGCAVALGITGKALGAKGCWITVAEWKQDEKYVWHRIDVRTAKVDGKKIKAETFYQLVGGKFKEVA